ncbi:hypothetical protein L798_06353 [Zootermopsis nevadensis]|uniref:Uncharacterized protein n=1 Tax=Zootermopsis nevadensis TaxID=136037 RepID=A0A067R7P9_ZOONE|nr:hypothetical protein L798_06353 [Zootermopsis nevadensis]
MFTIYPHTAEALKENKTLARTHLLHRSCHCWKHRQKASFGIFRSLAFDLMSSMVEKRAPLRPIFRVGNSQKSLGARSRECGGWVMTGKFHEYGSRIDCMNPLIALDRKLYYMLLLDYKFILLYLNKILTENICGT